MPEVQSRRSGVKIKYHLSVQEQGKKVWIQSHQRDPTSHTSYIQPLKEEVNLFHPSLQHRESSKE
jgi:hypothetical protein